MHYFYEFQCLVESNFRSHILHSLVFSQSSLLEILSDTEIIEVLKTAHLPSCRQVTTAGSHHDIIGGYRFFYAYKNDIVCNVQFWEDSKQ